MVWFLQADFWYRIFIHGIDIFGGISNELKRRKKAMFPSKTKIDGVFFLIFQVEGLQRGPGIKEKFQKMLLLVFEVIVQPSKHTFKIEKIFSCFSSLDWFFLSYQTVNEFRTLFFQRNVNRKWEVSHHDRGFKKSSGKNIYIFAKFLHLFFSITSAKLLTSNLQVGTVIFKEKYLIKHDWYLRVLCH